MHSCRSQKDIFHCRATTLGIVPNNATLTNWGLNWYDYLTVGECVLAHRRAEWQFWDHNKSLSTIRVRK